MPAPWSATDARNRWAGTVLMLVAVLAGCGDHVPSSRSQAPTASSRAAGIPDDFPLAQGLEADGDTTVSAARRDVPGVELAPQCWRGVWPGPAVDRLVVQQSGPELSVTRELAVYRDEASAVAVAEQVRVMAAQCHRLPSTSGEGPAEVTQLPHAAGARVAASFAETLTDGRPGGEVFVFSRVGRAILAVEDSSEWTRDSAVSGVREQERADRAVVDRMCRFRPAGC